jgi:hypothetical protein
MMSLSETQLQNLPQRYSEPAFRRWELIIKAAVELLPSRLELPPRPEYSQETVACGVRNAMRSLFEHRWSTVVDMTKFLDWYPKIEVARDGVSVIVQSRQRKPQQVDATPPTTLVITNPTDDEIKAAVVLRIGQRIAPVLFHNTTKEQNVAFLDIEREGKVAFNFQDSGILMV